MCSVVVRRAVASLSKLSASPSDTNTKMLYLIGSLHIFSILLNSQVTTEWRSEQHEDDSLHRTESLIFRLIYAENYSKWIKGDLSSYAFISFLLHVCFAWKDRKYFPRRKFSGRWISEISGSILLRFYFRRLLGKLFWIHVASSAFSTQISFECLD